MSAIATASRRARSRGQPGIDHSSGAFVAAERERVGDEAKPGREADRRILIKHGRDHTAAAQAAWKFVL